MERAQILDTSVAIERDHGVVTVFTAIEYPSVLEQDFEILWPTNEDIAKAVELSAGLYKIGKPIPAPDVLIASMVILRKLCLLTKDKHFAYVKEIEPQFEYKMVKN